MAEDLEMHGAYTRLRFVSQKVFRGAGGGGGGGGGGGEMKVKEILLPSFQGLTPRISSSVF